MSPLTTSGEPVPLAVAPPGDATTVYPVTALPPSKPGALNATEGMGALASITSAFASKAYAGMDKDTVAKKAHAVADDFESCSAVPWMATSSWTLGSR